jgi:integrase
MTVGTWIDHCISIDAPGKPKKEVGRRTLDRYEELLWCHVTPTLGKTRLQQLRSSAVDKLYAGFNGQMCPTTAHLHTVFKSCMSAAVRKRLISRNPVDDVEKIPGVGVFDHRGS